MYDPTFMRQVALAIHTDHMAQRERTDRVRPSPSRTPIHAALGLVRRSRSGSPAVPVGAEPQTLFSN